MPEADGTRKVRSSPGPAQHEPKTDTQNDESEDFETTDSPAKNAKPSPAVRDAKSAGKPEQETKAEAAATPKQEAKSPSGTGRERKQVQAFKPDDAKEQVKFSVKPGKGTKLRDIPNVQFLTERVTSKDELMELLHTVMFKRKGTDHERKRNVLDFSGFSWDADQVESERSKIAAKLDKAHVTLLHRMLDVFQLARGTKEDGQKAAKVGRLIAWLEAPRGNPDKKNLADKVSKKKTASATKRKRTSDVDGSASKRTKAGSTKTIPTKSASKKSKKAAEADSIDSESEDDVPLDVVAKLPSDKALKAKVESILESVDVREFNLRALLEQLKEHYSLDVSSKKPLIKNTAIMYCLNHGPQAADSDAEDESCVQDEGAGEEGDQDEDAGEGSEPVEKEEAALQAAVEVVTSVRDQQPLQDGADDVKEAATELKDVADCDAKEAAAEAAVVAADDAAAQDESD